MNQSRLSVPPASPEAQSPPLSDAASGGSGGGVLNLLLNVVGAVLILGLGVSGLVFFGRKPEVPTNEAAGASGQTAVLVETAEVQVWDLPFHLQVDGEAATYRVLTVGAEVSGRVLKKAESTRSGTFVNEGDLLFEIDSLNYRLDEARQQARVVLAQEELQAVNVDLQNTAAMLKLAAEDNRLQQNHLERVRSLYERKATSESELENAIGLELASRNDQQTQQNQLSALTQQKKNREASLQLALAELQRAKADLERCRIVAPITGRIVDDLIEEGDYIKPGDPMVHISDSSRMEIKCSLKGEELAWVWRQRGSRGGDEPGTPETPPSQDADGRQEDPFRMPHVPCEVAFEFEGVETIWDGYLSRYEGTGIDRNTRMFPCRVVVEHPAKTRVHSSPGGHAEVSPPTLLSGMYVTVRIPIDSPVPLLKLPTEAVRPGEQLWVVRDGRVVIVPTSLVRVEGDVALVRQTGSALQAGDRVIISPLAAVADGMAVSVKESQP